MAIVRSQLNLGVRPHTIILARYIMLTENSILRKPPAEFSRRQVLVLDGIRYAAEMALIAY